MHYFILTLLSTLALISAPLQLDISESDRLEPTQSFAIQSDSPIFPVKTTYSLKDFMKCSEKIDVIYKIESASKLKVIPKDRWSAGKTYQCQLDNTLLNEANNTVYNLHFTTQDLKLESLEYFENDKMVRFALNDRVNIGSLKKRLKFIKKNNLSKTDLQYDIATDDSRIFLVTLKENTGDDLDLVIEKGLKSLTGSISNLTINQNIRRKKAVNIDDKSASLGMHNKIEIKESTPGIFEVEIYFGNEIDSKDLKPFVQVDGIKNFEVRTGYQWYGKYRYKVILKSKEFKPKKAYTVRLLKGLKALEHDRVLKKDQSFLVTMPDLESRITFTSDKNYISNLGEIGLTTTNVGKATFVLSKITDDNYRYMTNINHNNNVREELTEVIYTKDIILDNPFNVPQKQKIRLKDIEGKLSHGIYRIEAIFERDENTYTATKDIYMSDIGISLNLSEKQVFVSLARLSDASPIADAKVDLYTNHNIQIGSVRSNENGIAVISPDDKTYNNLGSIIVTTKEDKNFLAIQSHNIVNSITGERLQKKEEKYKAHIYFQSDIIRPSAMIHALVTVKDKDFISAENLPLKITLVSMDGDKEEIDSNVYKTDALGLINYAFKMQNHHKTGQYRLNVYLGDKKIGTNTIHVEAFIPPKIENTLKTDKEKYTTSDIAKIEVTSKYLHGMPASGLEGKITVHAVDKAYANKKYPQFSFINKELKQSNETSYLSMEENIILNDQGKYELVIPLHIKQKAPSIIEAMIGATIMDDGQPVSIYNSIDIFPYESMVGLQILNENIKTDTELKGNTLLIDPKTNKILDRELTVVIKKKNWYYNYINGRYDWAYEDEIVDRFKIKSNTSFSKRMKQYGSYIIEVHDRLGGHSSSSSFDVSGWNYQNISPDKGVKKIDITFEDKLYKVGDTVTVKLHSPIPDGTMLLTLEGDRIYWYDIAHYKNGTATVEVPLGDAFKYGLYLHATAIRGTEKPSALIPFRATGYAYLKKDRSIHGVDVKLDHKAVTPSKSTFRLNVKTDKESALLISVVDKGILNILGQKPPKIFEFFSKQQKQKIMYLDLYDDLMHHLVEGKLLAFGADDDEVSNEKRKKHLPPENSDRVKPFMLWSDLVYTTDKNLSIDLKIPEFNGEAIVIAIAVTKDSIGVADSSFIVKDDLMIKPAFPRFVLEGDKMQVPLRIFNTSDKEKTINLEHKISDNMAIKYDTELTLPPKTSKVIQAVFESKKEGKGYVEFFIHDQDKTYTKRIDLLTMNPYALQTKTFAGSTSVSESIIVPKPYIGGTLSTTLSNNILGKLRSDLKYLVRYPYGCAEQISSRISSMYYALPFFEDDTLLLDAKIFIQSGMDDIVSREEYNGEIAYWNKGGYVNKEASLYAADTLLMLGRNGYELTKDAKSRIISSLKSIAKGNQSSGYTEAQRIYAAFILSENDNLEMSTANMMHHTLLPNADNLSIAYMAAMYINLGERKLANKIYSASMRQNIIKTADTQDRPFSSDASDAATFLYLNAKYFEKSHNDYLNFNAYLKDIYSTYAKAAAIKALNTYAGKSASKEMIVKVGINGQKQTYSKNITFEQKLEHGNISLYPLSGVVNYSFEIYKHLPYRLKNVLTYNDSYWLDQHITQDPVWTGINIMREFIDKDGNIVDLKNLQQGQKIYSRLTIHNFDTIENVVVSQRFPACMDIVNDRISKGKHPVFNNDKTNLDYQDIRDDRVLYFISLGEGKIQYNNKSIKTLKYVQHNITEIYTPLIITTKGEFKLPAVIVEAMYDPRIKDYAKQVDSVIVRDNQ